MGTGLVAGAVACGYGTLGTEAAEHESQNESAARRPARRIGSCYARRGSRPGRCPAYRQAISTYESSSRRSLIGNLDMRSAQTVPIPKLPHYPSRDAPFGRIRATIFLALLGAAPTRIWS